MNECTLGLFECDENALCSNRPGDYACICNAGFETIQKDDVIGCKDVDECRLELANCPEIGSVYNNTAGSFTCMCSEGFFGDGLTYSDVNECLTVGFFGASNSDR